MSLTLAASQDALAKRADVVPARLFKLTTYTDREQGIVDREFYWSIGAPWLYEYGGGAYREFDDLVLSASPFEYAMQHLPSPTRADVRRTATRIALSNADVDGVPFWKTLSADALAFARLEASTLLIEPERLVPNTPWWDLRDLAGTEHVVRFRGELTSVEDVSDEAIVLLFEGEEPNVDWPEVLADDASPRDRGRRYATPVGRAKGIPCINRTVGWTATLGVALDESTTGDKTVGDASGFPATGTFTVQIGSERMTAAYVNDTTINISARAQGGTLTSEHGVGDKVIEIRSAATKVAVSGVPIVAVDALYATHPTTRERVLVTTPYTTTLADVASDPGLTLTTVAFSASEMEQLIDELAVRSAGGQVFEVKPTGRTVFDVGGNRASAVDYINSTESHLIGDLLLEDAVRYTVATAEIPTTSSGLRVRRWRVVATVTGSGYDNSFYPDTDFGLTAALLGGSATASYLFNNGVGLAPATETDVVVSTAWQTPATPKTLADLVGGTIDFYLNDSGPNYQSGNWVTIPTKNAVIEVEVITQSQFLAFSAVAFGEGLEFWADVQGVGVPYEKTAGYGFDEGTGWSTAGGATQSDLGNGIQRIACTANALIADTAGACDDQSLWTDNACVLTNETTIKTQGTGSLKLVPNASGSDAYIERNFTANADWTGKAIAIDLRPEGATHISASDGVQVRFEDAGGDWRRWDFGAADGLIIGQFVTLVIDPTVGWDDASGTFTITTIDRIRVKCNQYAAGGSTANILYVDNIRLVDIVNPAIAQRNATAAAVDLTTTSLRYWTRMRATNVAAIASVLVKFSNTAGVGTTPPAAYRTLTIPGSELAENAWVEVEKLGVDTGAPGVNNIETVRIEILRGTGGAGTPSIDFDSLVGALATNSQWDGATPGALIEAGPDVLRWFIGELSGVGAANVLGVATAKTNLGADVFAGNLCALGADFGSVLARLCFETRTNVVRREGASAAQYQLLAASSAYAFPASTVTLEELSGLRESLRAASEIATHYRFLYAVELADAQVANNESAYRALLRADPSVSDLATPTAATLGAAAAVLGRRDSGPIYLLLTQAEATAKEIAGYYAAELVAYARRRWALTSPLWEAYALEPGDVVAFTPRWAAAAVKARVVGVTIDLADPGIGLAMEEVL